MKAQLRFSLVWFVCFVGSLPAQTYPTADREALTKIKAAGATQNDLVNGPLNIPSGTVFTVKSGGSFVNNGTMNLGAATGSSLNISGPITGTGVLTSTGGAVTGGGGIEVNLTGGISTATPITWAGGAPFARFRLSRPTSPNPMDLPRHYLINPYEWGMAVEYPGTLEHWVAEFSIKGNQLGYGFQAPSFWVGDNDDTGGLLVKAMNAGHGPGLFTDIASETFQGGSHGPLRLRVPNASDSFEWRVGDRPISHNFPLDDPTTGGSDNSTVIARMTGGGRLIVGGNYTPTETIQAEGNIALWGDRNQNDGVKSALRWKHALGGGGSAESWLAEIIATAVDTGNKLGFRVGAWNNAATAGADVLTLYSSGAAVVAGNVTVSGGTIKNGATVQWMQGTGSPESVVTAPKGSLYTRTDGGAGTTLYIKESGTGNTGWIAK